MRTEHSLGGTWSRANVRLLEVFACVAETGTMSAAGQRLGISQAAVSQSVTTLEDTLGVRLLDRSVRPPALTLIGRSVLRCATQTLEKLRELEDTVRYAASGRVPLLRIGMLNSFTSTAGASLLEQLRDVADEWTVTSGFGATTFQALLDRRVDAVITSDQAVVPESVDALDLATEWFVLAVPATYGGRPTDVKTMASELDFIRFGRDAHMSATIDEMMRRSGVRGSARYQFDTTDAVLNMVSAGFGWTVISPLILLKSMVPAGTIRLFMPAGDPLLRTVRVAMRVGESPEILRRIRSAALRSLREVVLPRVTPLIREVPGAFSIASDDGETRRTGRRSNRLQGR